MMEGWIQRGNLRNINQWAFRKLKQLQYCYVQAIQVNWCDKMSTRLKDKRHIFWVHGLPPYSSSHGLLLTSPGLSFTKWTRSLNYMSSSFAKFRKCICSPFYLLFLREKYYLFYFHIFSPLPKQLQKLIKNWNENNYAYSLYSILVCLILSYETLYM